MTKRTKTLGDAGEDVATTYLQNKGYNILAKNFRYSRFAEVDIIAKIDDIVIFVEVKTRRSQKYGTPAEAVNIQKQHKIFKAATKFLKDNNLFDISCRFDIIEVFASNEGEAASYKVNHIQNAFEVSNF